MEHHVRFAEEHEVHDEGHVLSIEEQASVFYSWRELLAMKQRAQLSLLLSDRELKKLDMSLRGLEKVNMSRAEVTRQKEFSREFFSLQLSLRHADAQEREGYLSQFLASRSKAHEKEAARIAKKDEVDARRVYRTDNMWWTPSKGQDNYPTTSKRKSFLGNLAWGFRPSREPIGERKASLSPAA
jgi:hypothetical protein